jgi:molecular chaperone DnaK
LLLLDVTPLALGLATQGGAFTPLVGRNSTIPTMKKRVFTTVADNQPGVSLRVVQGESPVADRNRFLDQLDLEGLAPAPRGRPRVEVTFDVDHNGILRVTARDLASGKEKTKRLARCRSLSSSEAHTLRRQAETNAAQDLRQRALIDARNEADLCIYQAEGLLQTCAEHVTEAEQAPIRDLVARLRLAVGGDDVGAIRRAHRELEQTLDALLLFLKKHRPMERATRTKPPGDAPGSRDAFDFDLEV